MTCNFLKQGLRAGPWHDNFNLNINWWHTTTPCNLKWWTHLWSKSNESQTLLHQTMHAGLFCDLLMFHLLPITVVESWVHFGLHGTILQILRLYLDISGLYVVMRNLRVHIFWGPTSLSPYQKCHAHVDDEIYFFFMSTKFEAEPLDKKSDKWFKGF